MTIYFRLIRKSVHPNYDKMVKAMIEINRGLTSKFIPTSNILYVFCQKHRPTNRSHEIYNPISSLQTNSKLLGRIYV